MTSNNNPLDLDAIEARAQAAEDGWTVLIDEADPHRFEIHGDGPTHVAVFGGDPDDAFASYPVRENAVFAAHAREDVPALLDEVRRLRAELADQQAETEKLIRWRREDETAMKRMRGTIERLRTELAAVRTKTLATEADEIVAHCPDHGSKDGVWMDCHCAVADDLRRRAAAASSV